MKSILFIPIFFLLLKVASAQSPQNVWDSIKANIIPIVLSPFDNEFEVPYKQPLADYGWEDGLHISPDGLHLYCLYSPSDFFSYLNFFSSNLNLPLCSLFGNMSYIRSYANTYAMDMTTNPFGCDSYAANIDILYAQRNSIAESFVTWQLSGIARPFLQEGGPAPLVSETNPNALDLFMFTGDGDIWMMSNTSANPTGINSAIRLPPPINPEGAEFIVDNPSLTRLSGDTVIVVYEKYLDDNPRQFMYSISDNIGVSWSMPQAINSIDNSLGNIEHPFLHKDNLNQWWLYYSIGFTYISIAKQTISGNWDSWDTPEHIIHKGNAEGIGEPSLTNYGDISFSLVYKNNIINDATDVYDIDPWFLPINISTNSLPNIGFDNKFELKIYPNPFSQSTTFESNYALKNATLYLYNSFGQLVRQIENISGQSFILERLDLRSGIYFIILADLNGVLIKDKIIII